MKNKKWGAESVAILGNFNSTNFGNEITLAAVLDRLREVRPNARLLCICNGPGAITVARHEVETKPLLESVFRSPDDGTGPLSGVIKICIGLMNEIWHWISVTKTLRSVDVLLIPGTGLLTDANGVRSWGWGPYYCFKWSLVARLLGRKLCFVSVGAGPIYSFWGRVFTKAALSFSHFRSYRDQATKDYLRVMGFVVEDDPVYPDLVFGCSDLLVRTNEKLSTGGNAVGLGIMEYAGTYSISNPTDAIQQNYLNCVTEFAQWVIRNGNELRLIIGDLCDANTRHFLAAELLDRLQQGEKQSFVDEAIVSVEELLRQIAMTDIVVATRFHNLVLALRSNKPVIAISFHQKCESLMAEMGLSAYCLDINTLRTDALIDAFSRAKSNSQNIRTLIRNKVAILQRELDEQYEKLFENIFDD
jgi:polysaccharide pyruvyl transferase WcaK-like protein